jgi:hypothetical protein
MSIIFILMLIQVLISINNGFILMLKILQRELYTNLILIIWIKKKVSTNKA